MLLFKIKKFRKMQNIKGLAVNLLVVVAGVLIATKIKEQMDRAKVSAPATK